MCGIAGGFDISGSQGLTKIDIELMVSRIAHRGPDGVSVKICGDSGLGFARLAINDPEAGLQPFTTENGGVLSICNGAITNWKDLRAMLEKRGHRFISQCDTEVVSSAYREYGDDCVNKLYGQFAFAIADQRKRRLLLARDRFGICPLFYTFIDEKLYFASEIKALLALQKSTPKLDLTGLDQALTFYGTVCPRTMFQGIYSLPPGHCLSIGIGESCRSRSYWNLEFDKEPDEEASETDLLEELDELFTLAVKCRIDADVATVLYLSGGLDSSLIGARACRLNKSGLALQSYSVDIQSKGLSERNYQLLVAEALQTSHKEIAFSPPDVWNRLHDTVYHSESPIKASFDTATFTLAQQVRKDGGRLILSGEGADELFAGYVGYRFDQARRRKPTSQAEAAISTRLWGDSEFIYEGELIQICRANAALFRPEIRQDYWEFSCVNQPLIDTERMAGLDILQRRSYIDTKLRLGSYLLANHGDRMALANGVEVRYPFLDERIAEFACRLHSKFKIRGLTEKYLLRRMGEPDLPRKIAHREKFAFTASGGKELLDSGGDFARQLLDKRAIERHGVFDFEQVERMNSQYKTPGYQMNVSFERDLLLFVASFSLFADTFNISLS